MKAKFITVDGVDGVGKTTQLNVMREWFEHHQLPVVFTREPGGTDLGEKLREILLAVNTKVSIYTETLLMFATRRQHLEEVILPALAAGKHVVSDRFTDATFAYQGGGRGVPFEKIEILENWVQGRFRPDLTLLLDVPLEVSLQRVEKGGNKDRFEREDEAFFKRVQASYYTRLEMNPERYCLIDSNREKALVKAEIEQILNRLFALSTS